MSRFSTVVDVSSHCSDVGRIVAHVARPLLVTSDLTRAHTLPMKQIN